MGIGKSSRRRVEGSLRQLWTGVEKFGIQRIRDATNAWVKSSDDIKKIGEAQVSGAAGRRKF